MYKNPKPTVDIIIHKDDAIVLIERNNPPLGWALPGGFVDEGEQLEHAAIRETKEETGLDVTLQEMLYVYSNPKRDPRQHNISVVYIGEASGNPQGNDDANVAQYFPLDNLPTLVFDHAEIIADYKRFKETGRRPTPAEKYQP
jgi:8-oxo-dGTP diphosphatase